MKVAFTGFLLILLSACAMAQASASMISPKRAVLRGIVTKDPGGEPVKKALIELIAENQAEGGNYTAETAADGTFLVEDVLPGRYLLLAERTGFLDIEKRRRDGRVLSLSAGQELTDVHIRFQASAVIRGRVTDEEGDPMQGAQVTVMRQTFPAGHHHWEQVLQDQTNDLGEYRLAGLAPGNVYVAVSPPPDFRTLIENGGRGADRGKQSGPEKPPPPAYQTTYYPGTADRSQATPVQLHAGDDFPVNFSLTPGPSLSIQGAVVNLPPKSSATIMLQSRDFNLAMSGTEVHNDGSFVIRNVSPGSYILQAMVEGSAVPMTVRQELQVVSTNVEGLRLIAQPGATVRARLRVESNGSGLLDLQRTFLKLQPADDEEVVLAGQRIAEVAADGNVEWNGVPPGTYYVEMAGSTASTQDWFLKTVLAGGRDANDSGISVSGGLVVVDLVASANGGTVDGVVTNEKGEPVSNTEVVAVPEARWRGREDRFRQTVSDQTGHFSLHGIRPGNYTLFAGNGVEGDEYYDPDFVRNFDGQGTPLRVNDGERKAVQLLAIHPQEESQ